MDDKTLYLTIVVALVALLSWFIRAVPFILFGRSAKPPEAVSYIGRMLSPAAIAMLVVYCFAGHAGPSSSPVGCCAEIAAAAVTVALQWKFRCPPLSIAVGTALYMAAIG
jgi:branched-subunit amino acid transport protein AzlD